MAATQLRFQYDGDTGKLKGQQKEAIQSSTLSQCGKTIPYSSEEDHRKELSSEDQEMIAMKTPYLRGLCINSGL